MTPPSLKDIRRAVRVATDGVEREGLFRARLGKRVPGGIITDVPNQPGKVFIRLYRNGGVSLTTAISRGIPLTASTNDNNNDIWVKIDPKTASYVVDRRIEIVDTDQPVAPLNIPKHRHNIGSGNEDPVEGLRLLMGLVHRKAADDTLTVRVRSFTYKTGTGFAIFESSDFDLTPYLPVTNYTHAWVIVGFDPGNEELVAVTGTEYATTNELTNAEIAEIEFPYIPLAAVKLKAGQTVSPDYRDIVDLREWFSTVIPTIYAPTNAKFWVSEPSSDLSAEVNIGALGDGLLYTDATAGVSTPSIATSSQIVGSIADGDIPAAKIAANSLTAAQIAANAITSSELADNAVDTAAIQDDAVTGAKIADGEIDTNHLVFPLENVGLDSPIIDNASISNSSITNSEFTDELTLNNTSEPPTPSANRAALYLWEDASGFADIRLKDELGILRSLSPHIITVRNATGSTISKHKIVQIVGTTSNKPQALLAQANSLGNCTGELGMVLDDIANNSDGRVITYGFVYNVDTSAGVGNFYLSTTAGNWSTSAPSSPGLTVRLGSILTSHATTGVLLFMPRPVDLGFLTGMSFITNVAETHLDNEQPLGALGSGPLWSTTTTGALSIATLTQLVNLGLARASDRFWVGTASSDLSNEMNLGSLTTGLVKITVSGGVATPSTAVANTDYMPAVAGSANGNLLRWNGSAWASNRPYFGEMVALAATGAVANFTLSSLSTLNGDFDHLMLVLQLRTDRAATRDGLTIQFNADTSSANYISLSSLIAHSNTLTTTENLTSTYSGGHVASAIAGSTAGSDHYPILYVYIPNYRGATHKVVTWNGYSQPGTGTGSMAIYQGGFTWLSTSAITSIKFLPEFGSNFAANSTYSLYGIGAG